LAPAVDGRAITVVIQANEASATHHAIVQNRLLFLVNLFFPSSNGFCRRPFPSTDFVDIVIWLFYYFKDL